VNRNEGLGNPVNGPKMAGWSRQYLGVRAKLLEQGEVSESSIVISRRLLCSVCSTLVHRVLHSPINQLVSHLL